jgi:hypothetical protein
MEPAQWLPRHFIALCRILLMKYSVTFYKILNVLTVWQMKYGKELVFLEYERGTGASVLEEINIEYKRESHREKYMFMHSVL